MDAAEVEGDVKLQRASAELLADLARSLPPFLRKPDGTGTQRLRSRVRKLETYRLELNILAQFQELPQLLDTHLPSFIPLLSDAYLEHLYLQAAHGAGSGNAVAAKRLSARSHLLEPLPQAIGSLLYSFCKIRGEKVIVRFFSVETRHLELILGALEEAERAATDPAHAAVSRLWRWEERYVVLLWLSHLLFAPFDLASISSVDMDDENRTQIPNFTWPRDLPGLAIRVLPLAIKYLASPGKERDAAKAVLVRISMRRDMQSLGVLDALIHWALASLRPRGEGLPVESPYYYIGVLSYLAGVLRASVDTSDMDKYLMIIFESINNIITIDNPTYISIRGSAVARKTIIKVLRSIDVIILRQETPDMETTQAIEACISYLLECLSDNDTPVRLSASKALSIVTLRLDPEMAGEVVDAVLENLNRNVFWRKNPKLPDAPPTRDTTSVDPLGWHGLMLTLAHLLYRRSPPPEQLSDIIHALLLGLSFEQRSTSGSSVGANVRDAACFGIWALSRRYTTAELQNVSTNSVYAAKSHPPGVSILQVLATELVVAASRDPAGNIRRGSSAALQELIGRHPDTVEKGIWVVQAVDYHAVARRSRAMQDVASQSARLSIQYGEPLLDSLLGWRGVGDVVPESRRVAGTSFGTLTLELSTLAPVKSLDRFKRSARTAMDRIAALETREVEDRHGLLLSLAAVFDQFPALIRWLADDGDLPVAQISNTIVSLIKGVVVIVRESRATSYRRPELIAEAAGRLTTSSLPLLVMAARLSRGAASLRSDFELLKGDAITAPGSATDLSALMQLFDQSTAVAGTVKELSDALGIVMPSWLDQNDEIAIPAVVGSAVTYLIISEPKTRNTAVQGWIDTIMYKSDHAGKHGNGYFHALTMALPVTKVGFQRDDLGSEDKVCSTVLERWALDKDIDNRVAILQAIAQSDLLLKKSPVFLDLLFEALNDYTTTARGDIGSLVRLAALRATHVLWGPLAGATEDVDGRLHESAAKLFPSVLRLAAEKLDRVRFGAQQVLTLALTDKFATSFKSMTFTSQTYFYTMLTMLDVDCILPLISETVKADASTWMAELLSGYVTSADTGNEDLVIASRAALCDFCEASDENLNAVCLGLMGNLRERQGQDRVLVPTLEIIAFLFNAGIFQECDVADARSLCLLVQRSGYKSGNVRKLEACTKVFGNIASLQGARGDGGPGTEGARLKRCAEAVVEARKRLGALMLHPWPKVRNLVADEIWGLLGDDAKGAQLKGVDWGTADKETIRTAMGQLGIA